MLNRNSVANVVNFTIAIVATVLAGFFVTNPFCLMGIFFLSYPWKIKKNVYSLFGGVNVEGSVYSLCAIFQIARDDTFSIFGFSLFQKAGEDSGTFIGFCFLQEAKTFKNGIFYIPFFQKKI